VRPSFQGAICILNLETAKASGLTIPQVVIIRAGEMIQ